MIVNEPTGFKDVNGRDIKLGDTVRILFDKVENLVSQGQLYKVFLGQGGVPCIQVGVSLEEIKPQHYCEVVDSDDKDK